MEEIRVLIADDDEGMRLIERKMIEREEGFTLVGEASDGDELLGMAEEKHPQIIFLDVEMPGKTGIECARVLQDTDPGMILIFATAHDDYMSEAFEVYAFDYLLKPFKMERVQQTLNRARQVIEHTVASREAMPAIRKTVTSGRLMLRHRDGVSFINMNDILLVQRENRVTVIYTLGGGRYELNESLAETEARLDPAIFFRCHKSYIINLNYIRDITPYGRWTYVIRLNGTDVDALITHDKYEELEHLFA